MGTLPVALRRRAITGFPEQGGLLLRPSNTRTSKWAAE
jgi:hypothetical protein